MNLVAITGAGNLRIAIESIEIANCWQDAVPRLRDCNSQGAMQKRGVSETMRVPDTNSAASRLSGCLSGSELAEMPECERGAETDHDDDLDGDADEEFFLCVVVIHAGVLCG